MKNKLNKHDEKQLAEVLAQCAQQGGMDLDQAKGFLAHLLCHPRTLDPAMWSSAIAGVEPGGHFFGCEHTMARYRTAFYEPLVSDWSNFGTWQEHGSQTATQRANRIWKGILSEFEPPSMDAGVREALAEFVARRVHEGGAPPES